MRVISSRERSPIAISERRELMFVRSLVISRISSTPSVSVRRTRTLSVAAVGRLRPTKSGRIGSSRWRDRPGPPIAPAVGARSRRQHRSPPESSARCRGHHRPGRRALGHGKGQLGLPTTGNVPAETSSRYNAMSTLPRSGRSPENSSIRPPGGLRAGRRGYEFPPRRSCPDRRGAREFRGRCGRRSGEAGPHRPSGGHVPVTVPRTVAFGRRCQACAAPFRPRGRA